MLCIGMMKQSLVIVDNETGSVLVIPPMTLPFFPPLFCPFIPTTPPPPPPPKVTEEEETERFLPVNEEWQ